MAWAALTALILISALLCGTLERQELVRHDRWMAEVKEQGAVVLW